MNTQKTIQDINELLNTINDVTIEVVDERGFEVLLGKIYLILHKYHLNRAPNQKSLEILSISHRILNKILQHHISQKFNATLKMAKVFDESVKLLLCIIFIEFGINEFEYHEYTEKRSFIRALKASEIALPGYNNFNTGEQWVDKKLEDDLDNKALSLASENIKKFANFAFGLGRGNVCVDDSLFSYSPSEPMRVYSLIRSLSAPAILRIDAQDANQSPTNS